MRESPSRAMWPVPSEWRADGGWRMRLMWGLWGSWGDSRGAAAAMMASTRTTAPPQRASRFLESARQNAFTRSPSPAPAHADARVDQAVREIRDQVGHQRHARDDHQIGHDHRVVALVDGLHHELPHAGDREDRLHDDAAADEAGHR